MASAVAKVRLCEVLSENGPAKYRATGDIVLKGDDYAEVVSRLAQADRTSGSGFDWSIAGADTERPGQPAGSRDGLDLNLGAETGVIAVAFRLPPPDAIPGLIFNSPPLVELQNNFAPAQAYLQDAVRVMQGQDRWATVLCDLDAVRASKLAKAIEGLENDDHHNRVLRIPFMLNVVDTMLGFAPWVLPEEAPHDDGLHFLTHGGVHPNAVYYMSVDLG